MKNVVTAGKRFIPLNEVAFVEPYEARDDAPLQSTRNFRARLVLIDRQSVLTEEDVEPIAHAHGLRLLGVEQIAVNAQLRFKVETFTPASSFAPTKPFKTRLKWNDRDGHEQSKLLLTEPQAVLSVLTAPAASAETSQPSTADAHVPRPARSRKARATAGEPQGA